MNTIEFIQISIVSQKIPIGFLLIDNTCIYSAVFTVTVTPVKSRRFH